jgi:hypothetical protein
VLQIIQCNYIDIPSQRENVIQCATVEKQRVLSKKEEKKHLANVGFPHAHNDRVLALGSHKLCWNKAPHFLDTSENSRQSWSNSFQPCRGNTNCYIRTGCEEDVSITLCSLLEGGAQSYMELQFIELV